MDKTKFDLIKQESKLYKIKGFTCAFQEVVCFGKITGDNWKDKCDKFSER